MFFEACAGAYDAKLSCIDQERPQTFKNWTHLRGLTGIRVYPRHKNDKTQLLKERLC